MTKEEREALKKELIEEIKEQLSIDVEAGNESYGGPYIEVTLSFGEEKISSMQTSVPAHSWYDDY